MGKTKQGCNPDGGGGGGSYSVVVLNMMRMLILVLTVLPSTTHQQCPSDCSCKWKGGKQWVECVTKNLRTFPPTIDSGTQVLDISGNSFETLPPDHFMRSGLINLQKIFLSRCRLSHINSRAFRGLSNLVELDLSSNHLRDVPSPAFPDTPGLMRLVLSSNPIPVIAKRAFVPLESLTTLELSSTGLELIETGAFEGLHVLEWLKLDGNRLKWVKGLSILPLTLKGLSLEDNPWECDCHLLELRLWLADRNVASSAEPRCSTPDRTTNATIKSLPPESFACFPQLSPTTMFQKIAEGKNVSLLCKVLSVPESSLEWLFNGQPLTNSSLNLLVETTSAYPSSPSQLLLSPASQHPSLTTPVEKKSELLILNATSDENGTFLCLARNPAGSTSANFTLRVLSKWEPGQDSFLSLGGGGAGDSYFFSDSIHHFPQFLQNYPNLFIILISTVAVIGLVLVLGGLCYLLCKCYHCCGGKQSGGNRSRRRRGSTHSSSFNNKNKSDHPGSCSNNSVVSVVGSAGHLNKSENGGSVNGGNSFSYSLSDASTLTTATKTNGSSSVYLLSSVGGGGGDASSNPDLIVDSALSLQNMNSSVRGDGDGLDAAIYNNHNELIMNQQQQQHHFQHQQSSPYYTSNTNPQQPTNVPGESNNQPSRIGGCWPLDFGLPSSLPYFPSSSSNLPPNYDLAKYPKEYISLSPSQSQHHQVHLQHPNQHYEYTVSPVLYSDYPTVMPLGYHHSHYPELMSSGPMNCSCIGPILEEEGLETETTLSDHKVVLKNGTQTLPPSTPPPSTATASTSPILLPLLHSSGGGCAVGKRLTNSVGTTTTTTTARSNAGQNGTINESPDEGYEDGGAEGTEI